MYIFSRKLDKDNRYHKAMLPLVLHTSKDMQQKTGHNFQVPHYSKCQSRTRTFSLSQKHKNSLYIIASEEHCPMCKPRIQETFFQPSGLNSHPLTLVGWNLISSKPSAISKSASYIKDFLYKYGKTDVWDFIYLFIFCIPETENTHTFLRN